MKPSLIRIGASQAPVVIVDDFSCDLAAIIGTAAALAPFPRHSANYYPGLRRIIRSADGAASDYVEQLCAAVAPFIGGAFDVDGFDLLEASYSMVTLAPEELNATQRAPHFDSTDPKYLAILHYLNVGEDSGTAFYRQRSTGIEQVTEANVATFIRTAERDAASLPTGAGYIVSSDLYYEQLVAIAGKPDRLLIYQGSLLHSGIIPKTANLSADPRQGRLTANLFVRAH